MSQPQLNFRQFGYGLGLFILGMTLIYATDSVGGDQVELSHELVTLVGLASAGLGFATAISAQILILAHRLYAMRQDRPPKQY
jgi:hypothetical protein